jgi:3-isopropylmalate dehydrogenase
MLLRYSFAMHKEAEQIEKAVASVLAQGHRTGDIAQAGMKTIGTREMGDQILAMLEKSRAAKHSAA